MSIPGSAAPPGATSIAVLQQQASEHLRANRFAEALAACRAILAQQPERPDVHAVAGTAALKAGDATGAVEHYRAALALRRDFVEAQFNLGNAYRALGKPEDAVDAYRRALELRPDLMQAAHNLGSALQSLGRNDESLAAYRKVVERVPNQAETWRNVGLVLFALGRKAEAFPAFRRALALQPGQLSIYSNLATILMQTGDARAAVALCDEWLAKDPGEVEAHAFKIHALIESGDRAAAKSLLAYDRLVWQRRIAPPLGFADLAAFNAALDAHVSAHPTLKVPPADDPTYHHPALHITGELLDEPKGPIAALEPLVHDAVEAYRQKIAGDAGAKFFTQWPQRWKLAMWATLLTGEGNLVPHIHLEGFLSGVYYVTLPRAIDDVKADRAGWFELGRPPSEWNCKAAPELHFVKPEPGLMLLFPAFVHHRTVPYSSGERRISIAFDVVPA
ncbi:MAG: tetratricopeptide repeat protein [Alphaproteobacteria bacterium]